MKNLIKLNIIFLASFIIFSSKSVAADRILPVPKPTVDQETKIKTAEKKYIYPQKKPTLKKEKIEITESSQVSEIDNVIIYPEKKPIIFHKSIDKAAAKSTFLSSKDFKIAKAAFESVKKKKWKTAIKLSKKNAKQLGCTNIKFLENDIFQMQHQSKYDLIIPPNYKKRAE